MIISFHLPRRYFLVYVRLLENCFNFHNLQLSCHWLKIIFLHLQVTKGTFLGPFGH